MVVFSFPQCHCYGWSWCPRFPSYALSDLGWGLGVVVLILSWIITLYTLLEMVEMHDMVAGKHFDRYHELGQYAFGEELGLYIVVPQQHIIEFGVCIAYMVAGGKSLKKFHDTVYSTCKDVKLTYFIMIFSSVHFVLSHFLNFNSISGVSLAVAVMSLNGYKSFNVEGTCDCEQPLELNSAERNKTKAKATKGSRCTKSKKILRPRLSLYASFLNDAIKVRNSNRKLIRTAPIDELNEPCISKEVVEDSLESATIKNEVDSAFVKKIREEAKETSDIGLKLGFSIANEENTLKDLENLIRGEFLTKH
ncbi:hypothetical protein REPUB_Repub09cG0120800 [Reevesia pubescens]